MSDTNPKLNNQEVTPEQLEESKKNLPKNQKIVETDKPGEFVTLTRMRD